jgi:hypothetical protein
VSALQAAMAAGRSRAPGGLVVPPV